MRTASRRVATALVTMLLAAGVVPAGIDAQLQRLYRPAWVVGDVPDTVWVLVERSVSLGGDDRSKELLIEAEALAREALRGREDDPDRRFGLAAVLGMRAEMEGGRTRVHAASELHDELVALLELDPRHARAHYMMGRLHAGVRRMNGVTRWLATNLLGGNALKGASWDGAVEHLAFAEAHAPEVPDHHLELACVYRDIGRLDLALEELDHVLAMRPVSPMEVAAHARAVEVRAGITRPEESPPHPHSEPR